MTALPSTDTGNPAAVSPATSRRRAAWGALAAAGFYLLQPLGVFVLMPEAMKPGYWPSPATLADSYWEGPYEAITFVGIAVGTLVLVLSLAQTSTPGLRTRLATAFGAIGAAGWIGTAALSLAARSTVAAALDEIGGDLVTQQSVFQGNNIVLTGLIGVAAFGAAGWAVCIGLAGGRNVRVPAAVAVIALIGGLLIALSATFTAQPILGALVLIPLYLVLAVALLLSSRRGAAQRVG